MTRSIWKGPFVDGYMLRKADARGPPAAPTSSRLEQALDDTAAVRGSHVRRLQRPQAHSGVGVGGDDRPQVRGVRADPHVSRPFRRQEGQEGLNVDAQAINPRRQAENEAKAMTRKLRVSPQKRTFSPSSSAARRSRPRSPT